MSNYICPFCGKEIVGDEVLFIDSTYNTAFFRDQRRYNFLFKCSTDYPFEEGENFRGLYFRCEEPNEIVTRDENGFPAELRVSPCNGLTPDELEGAAANEAENKKKSASTEQVVLPTRACPNCHCMLPLGFGTIPNYSVCLFGGRAAGKTAYLVALLQQLSIQLSACGLGSVSIVAESLRYFVPQMQLYSDTGITLPTPVDSKLFPLVLRYTNLSCSPPKDCFFTLYDIAGEGIIDKSGLIDEAYLAGHDGLKKAETVMLMLDPNMLCNGAYFHDSKIQEDIGSPEEDSPAVEESGNEHDFCSVPVTAFLSQTYVINSYLKDLKHIIAVVTKMDQPLTVDEILFRSPQSRLKQNNIKECHQRAVDTGELAAVSSELSRFFDSKLGSGSIREQIVNAFNGKVKKPLMLGVSTYTRISDQNGKPCFKNIHSKEASKHRIIEPFLALLYFYGLADSKKPSVQKAPQEKPKKRWLFGSR